MYKHGFVENISDSWIPWSLHQIKDFVFAESSELFFLGWQQWIHIEPWRAFLSPSLGPKGGRWEMTGQGSRCSLLPWNYSRIIQKHYTASPALWHFFLKRCTKVIKREHWTTQRFTDLATWRISFAETQDTHLPIQVQVSTGNSLGQPTSPETPTLSVQQQIAKNFQFFCFLFFANNIPHFANTEKENICLQ